MAKRYDPIMCMMVDEPTKAQDELKIKKEDGLWCVYKDGKVIGQSNSEAGALRLYRMFESKAQDAKYRVYYGMSHNQKSVIVEASSESEAAEKYAKSTKYPGTIHRVEKIQDSASALDKAIKTADGMFASAFGEYSKGAKFKKDKFLKELAGISDAKEFAKRMQTLDNELRKNLERLDEAYNVAGKDYYAARNEIRSIMDAFSSEAFNLYRKLDT